MEKMTKKDYFEALKGFVAGDEREAEFVAFLDRQIELASKKRTALTPVQKENLELVEKVYDYIAGSENGVTATDIMNALELTSNQKASALVKKLVDSERVSKTKDGKKTIYVIAE